VDIDEWFARRVPPAWGARGLEVIADPDEILVLVDLGARKADSTLARFRDSTREDRMAVAEAAEMAFSTKVSWGVRRGSEVVLFTTTSVPVMTRLRLAERRVLDTLIAGGVARTRSEALAWCVRLVGEHEDEWLADLRSAAKTVEDVRRQGPKSRRS